MPEAAAMPQKKRLQVPKVVRRLLLILAVLYFLPLAVLGVFQRQLVFNAAASRTGAPSPLPGAHLLWLRTKSGDHFDAYYGHALLADGTPDINYARRPTLLFFGGKGSAIAGERDRFQAFRRLDANVLMPDYLGFGPSEGQESETNCLSTAQASYQYLWVQPDIDQKRIVIAGYSLGSGVAIDLAAHEINAKQPMAGLALFAAYTGMAAMAHQEYPFYPTWLLRLILKYPFASDMKISKITCPVFLVHSRADTLIPYSMSNTLTALCRGPVTRLTITQAGHAEYFSVDKAAVYPALRRFLENTHETQTH